MSFVHILLLAVGVAMSAQTAVPPLLEQALRRLPGVAVLNPTTDLAGEYTVAELQDLKAWPPWLVRDVDRDGRPDVVAVVVSPGVAGQRFGVLALRGSEPSLVRWVVPLGPEGIRGVSGGPSTDTVQPLFCIECDTNPWYRWSGDAFERELYVVGEQLTVGEALSGPRGLFAQASSQSRFLFTLEECSTATVQRVAGSAGDRWYFVETKGPQPVRGWIPEALVAGSGECIG